MAQPLVLYVAWSSADVVMDLLDKQILDLHKVPVLSQRQNDRNWKYHFMFPEKQIGKWRANI